MGIDGAQVIRQYLENLAEDFYYHSYGDVVVVTTPYQYHDNDMIYVAVEELPGGMVRVCDQGEAVMHSYCHGFDLSRSDWGMEAVRRIARNDFLELDRGVLSKTGPAAELSRLIMDVVMAARGISDLLYAHWAHAHLAYLRKGRKAGNFAEKLTTFLAESSLQYTPAAKLAGGSGQVYTVHYRLADAAYLQALNPSQPARAKAAVDRAFAMWADDNGDLTSDRKLTLLNDETLTWKAAHIHRLSQVSTVIKWSEREKLPAQLASLS